MATKVTVNRYIKATIRSMQWEQHIVECGDKYYYWSAHMPKDGLEYTKVKERLISKEEADKFKAENEIDRVETYKRDIDPVVDKLFTL